LCWSRFSGGAGAVLGNRLPEQLLMSVMNG